MKVITVPYDIFSCPQCIQLRLLRRKWLAGETIDARRLADLEEHQEVAAHQNQAFKNAIENIGPSACVIVQDFTSYFQQRSDIQNLILALYFRDEAGQIQVEYFDIIKDTKNNVDFVTSAWQQLDDKGIFNRFEDIQIWSDGGPKHFKTNKALAFFSLMHRRTLKKLSWHFFASYHGHSICDRHAAHGKRLIKSAINTGRTPQGVESFAESLNCLNRTTVEILVDRANPILEVNKLKGIKSFHCFQFAGESVYCQRRTLYGAAVRHQLVKRAIEQ